jgi:hypothetical protein
MILDTRESASILATLLLVTLTNGAAPCVSPKDMSIIDRVLYIQRKSIAIAYASKIPFLLVEYHEMNLFANIPRKTIDIE